jgi:hypothetical protein
VRDLNFVVTTMPATCCAYHITFVRFGNDSVCILNIREVYVICMGSHTLTCHVYVRLLGHVCVC